MSAQDRTVRDLRRLWKPSKERLSRADAHHPTNIRFHRACSWMQRADSVADSSDYDLQLLTRWVAFNSLYGQWNAADRETLPDQNSWKEFTGKILALDEDQVIATVLADHKPLVMSILEDEYLSRYFWDDPTPKRASSARNTQKRAQAWYLDGNWILIMERLVERIYFLRCQLVHGAATFNSNLNRTSVRRCSQMIDHLLRSFLLVWAQHGVLQDWGALCYPPLNGKQVVPSITPVANHR